MQTDGTTSSSLLGPTLRKVRPAAALPGPEILRARPLLSLLLVWMLVCQTMVPPQVKQAQAKPHGESASSQALQNNDGGWLTRLVKAFAPASVPLPATAPVNPALDTLTDAVISRQHPNLNSGRIEGTLRVLAGQSFSINGNNQLTSDLYLVGTPTIQLNGNAHHGGIVDAGGAATPANYTVTLAGDVNMPGRILTHADAAVLPVDFPASLPAAAGTRTLRINSQSGIATIGDWQTVRDLSVSGNGLTVNVPPGNYGTFTVNGNNRLTADDTEYSTTADVTITVNPEPTQVNQPGILASMAMLGFFTYKALHNLPSNAFATMPDAALIGYEGSVNVAHYAGRAGPALAVATSLLNVLGGVDVLKPFSSPRLWIYGYGGVGIGLEVDDVIGGGSLSAHVGLIWNAKTSDAYSGPFFCTSFGTSSVNAGRWGFPAANLSLCSSTDQRTGLPGAYGLQAKVIQTGSNSPFVSASGTLFGQPTEVTVDDLPAIGPSYQSLVSAAHQLLPF